MSLVSGYIEMGLGSIADYYVIIYGWNTGSDLDTRTRMSSPVTTGYLGWGLASAAIPVGSTYVLRWGDDQTQVGYESVLVNVKAWRTAYSQTVMDFDLYAQWFFNPGTTPVVVSIQSYVGGTMYVYNNLWYNTTYTSFRDFTNYPTFSKVITVSSQNPLSIGEYIASLRLNLAADTATFST